MKKLYLLLLLITSISQAQIVTIPDANFKNALLNGIVSDTDGDDNADSTVDTNNDGEIQVSEAEAVTNLRLWDYNINSIEGIESFINIEIFRTSDNNLSSVDFSENLNLEFYSSHRENLTNVNVNQNINLISLNLIENNLTNLDVTHNSNLLYLDITGNFFSNIDISQNINLERFDFPGNNFNVVDLSHNINLKSIWCTSNPLSEIDLSNNVLLESFSCALTPLETFDFTHNINLKGVSIFSNNISSLDLSQNVLLEFINIQDNQISTIDISQNTELTFFACALNNITSLDFSQHPNLTYIDLVVNNLTYLNIQNGNNTAITNFRVFENPDLNCIQVDDVEYANNANWEKDETAVYNLECILGIEDKKNISFTLYPNPVQNILNIESQNEIETVKIRNLQGQLTTESSTNRIDVSMLTSGIYFIEVIANGKSKTKKIIKN